MKKIELKYLNEEINNLQAIETYDELTDYGKNKLASFIEIRKQLSLSAVSQRREQLFCPNCGAKNWDREDGNKHCLDCETCW